MKVFISYRRDDSALAAKLLHGELARHFGDDSVFMDIEDIGYGDDFVAAIDRHLEAADVVVVVVGPRWLELLQARLRGDDWVREEVRRALARRAATDGKRPRVVVALVDNAAEPTEGLPEDLKPLRSLNMLRIQPRALKESLNALAEAVQGRSFSGVADEQRRTKRLKAAALAAGVLAFIGGWVSLFDFLQIDTRVATATMRLSAALPGAATPPPADVVLAAIDRGTEAAVGRKFDASWRGEHARFLRRAADAGARTVAFDLPFESDGPEAADAELRDALQALAGRMPVVFAVQDMDGSTPLIAPRLAGLADWGIACAGERLGATALMPLVVERGRPKLPSAKPDEEKKSERYPSLALAAFSPGATIARPDIQAGKVAIADGKTDTFSAPFSSFEWVRRSQGGCPAIRDGDFVASQLVDAATLPPLDRPPQRLAYESVLRGDADALAALRGKIVLVGAQLPQKDLAAVAGGDERWGVELHAAQIEAIRQRVAIQPLPWAAQVALAVAMALAGTLIAARLRGRSGPVQAAALAAVGIAFVAAAVLLYRFDRVLVGVLYGLAALAAGPWLARLFLSGVRR